MTLAYAPWVFFTSTTLWLEFQVDEFIFSLSGRAEISNSFRVQPISCRTVQAWSGPQPDFELFSGFSFHKNGNSDHFPIKSTFWRNTCSSNMAKSGHRLMKVVLLLIFLKIRGLCPQRSTLSNPRSDFAPSKNLVMSTVLKILPGNGRLNGIITNGEYFL